MNVQEVIQVCEARVSVDAIRGSASLTASLCVDGTSATRKSTILERTGCLVHKIQRQTRAVDMDTYFPSAIGYATFGLSTQNCDEPHLYDRSHLNPFEWRLLWAVMDDYVRRRGNSRPREDSALWSRYRSLFEDLRTSYHYSHLRSRVNAVAFVDSNVARCDDARRRRGRGSDRERSDWLFYTPLQNLMYRTLYPDAHVDVAWFDHADPDCVTQGIALWLSTTLERLKFAVPSDQRVVRVPFSLPVAFNHLTLANVTAHMYRSMRRVACKREQEIADSRHPDVDADEVTEERQLDARGRPRDSVSDADDHVVRLSRYQPAFVTVRNASDIDRPGMPFDLPGRTRPDLSRRMHGTTSPSPQVTTDTIRWLFRGNDSENIRDDDDGGRDGDRTIGLDEPEGAASYNNHLANGVDGNDDDEGKNPFDVPGLFVDDRDM